MNKEKFLEKQKKFEDMISSRPRYEEWLKAHNFDPKVWGFAKVLPRTQKDKEIMVGDYLVARLIRKNRTDGNETGFLRVSSIKNNRLFFNEIRDRETGRVVTLPYRRKKGCIVFRTKRDGFAWDNEEIFFRGMRMSPGIHLCDEPLETWKEKCPFCGTRKNLTPAGGIGAGIRDFHYADFCERCKCLVDFDYDVEVGPIISISYRRRIEET